MKGLAKNLKSDTHAAAIKWSAKKKPNGNPAPPLQRHWDSVQPGLILAVRRSPGKNETGRKVWQVRANSIIEKTGKQSQSILKLGNFPAMGLDQARAKAALIREQANIGADVKITQQSNGLDTTVNTLFEAMFDLPRNGVARYPLQKRSAGYRYALEKTYYKHIAPQLGKMRIKDVTAEHWRDLIIEDVFLTQNKRGSASVLLGLCSTFYRNLKFHADPAIRTLENPLRGSPLAEKIGKFTRDRVLTIQELAYLKSCVCAGMRKPKMTMTMLFGVLGFAGK
jgi:hypothetical protein